MFTLWKDGTPIWTGSIDLKSGKQRGSKNNKLPRPNLDFFYKVKYTQNIQVFFKNIKKVGLISMECIGSNK